MQIKAFAAQFDPQPFHLDDEAAKGTLLGGLAASGWHTTAITMRLLVETGLPLMGGIIGAGGEISWPQPTRPGDILHVVSEIEEVAPSRSRPDRGMVKVRSETRNQRDEVVQVLIGEAHRAAARIATWLRAARWGEQAASGGAACPVQARRLGFVAGCWQHRGCIARVRACALRLADFWLNSARMSSISRRDFLNGAALTIAAGLTPAAQIAAQPVRYPPALTGLRGQHAGSFETAHAQARDAHALSARRRAGRGTLRPRRRRRRHQRARGRLVLSPRRRAVRAHPRARQPR